MTILLLLGAFAVILAGAELFTNAVEWLGQELGLAERAVGSVLAAVGTALPETMIPLVAIVFGAGSRSNAVGVGAILGAPFMLATLAMFVTGLAVLARPRARATCCPSIQSSSATTSGCSPSCMASRSGSPSCRPIWHPRAGSWRSR
jgi:Ca2+/Na+ antiporter